MHDSTTMAATYAEDRKVGIVIGSIGVGVALFMVACVTGLSMYYSMFYAAVR